MPQAGLPQDARRVAEQAARMSYGRLVSILAARSRDIAAAEDALGEAFRIALQVWPERGVPANAEAWLVTVARRELGHAARHRQVTQAAQGTLELLQPLPDGEDQVMFGDERLKLMFACAHPAIDASVQAPLMLQVVLGLDSARIAACFLTSPVAMGQRLVRAKTKIRDGGIAFAIPDADQLPTRLDAVLSAIYAAYGTGWEDIGGADPKRKGMAEEALWLARVTNGLLPRSPEARGLLALMLYCESRRAARRDRNGQFVPLLSQETALWSREMVEEAETLLRQASSHGEPGRFQIEAAIQSVHAQRAVTGVIHWPGLLALYDYLAALSPTLGVLVARASALAEAGQPARAIDLLGEIGERCREYQPFWAAKAHALQAMGNGQAARQAFQQAAGMTEDAAVRAYLLDRAG